MTGRRLARAWIAWLLSWAALWAPAAHAETILTLSFTDASGQQRTVAMDRADVQKLPQHSFSTNTPWTKEPHRYTGPRLRDLLASVGAGGTRIHARALNEYQIVIPVEDARRYDVIVAHRIDDQPIPVRKLGPLFVIYPFDQFAELQDQRFYGRSIWQLQSMKVE